MKHIFAFVLVFSSFLFPVFFSCPVWLCLVFSFSFALSFLSFVFPLLCLSFALFYLYNFTSNITDKLKTTPIYNRE